MNPSAGERVLWEGAPPGGVVLRSSDAVVVPVSVVGMWFMMNAGFALAGRPPGPIGAPALAVMLAMGLSMTAGRFLLDLWQRRRTHYWVTNQRVVIESGMLRPTTLSMSTQGLPAMVVTERGDGAGSIKFGEQPVKWGRLPVGQYWPGMAAPIQFEGIPQVRAVHATILKAQREAWGTGPPAAPSTVD